MHSQTVIRQLSLHSQAVIRQLSLHPQAVIRQLLIFSKTQLSRIDSLDSFRNTVCTQPNTALHSASYEEDTMVSYRKITVTGPQLDRSKPKYSDQITIEVEGMGPEKEAWMNSSGSCRLFSVDNNDLSCRTAVAIHLENMSTCRGLVPSSGLRSSLWWCLLLRGSTATNFRPCRQHQQLSRSLCRTRTQQDGPRRLQSLNYLYLTAPSSQSSVRFLSEKASVPGEQGSEQDIGLPSIRWRTFLFGTDHSLGWFVTGTGAASSRI
jgi:hypothetical protein